MPKLSFMLQSLALEPDKPDAFTVIAPSGFVDSSNYRTFERALEAGFDQGKRFAALDLSGVHFINSTGISAIIRYFGRYQERGGLLVLTSVPRSVGLSMHLLGVTSLVPFHKDLGGAREQFKQVVEGKFAPPKGAETMAHPDAAPRRKILVPVRRRKGALRDSRVALLIPKPTRFSRILSLRFKNLNGNFRVFHDTQEALQALGALKPDLVLVDDRMDPSGEFVTKLKVHPERSLISVVKIYSKDTDLDKQLNFKIWENDYLVDPFDILELFSLTEAELMRVPKDRKVFQQQIRFEFRTTRENLEKANKLADLIIRRSLDNEEDRTAMYAAVKEGMDNAVLHGNNWNPETTVDVNFLVDQSKVTVIIEDQGRGFDFEYYLAKVDDTEAFEKARKKIMEEGRRGGLGILLMHRCSDRIEYSGTGNILRLEKNRQ